MSCFAKCDNDSFHDSSRLKIFRSSGYLQQFFRIQSNPVADANFIVPVPQLRNFEFFRVVIHYNSRIHNNRARLSVRARLVFVEKSTCSTEIVIATPYNDSIDIIHDSPTIADFSSQCDFH